MKVTPTFFWLIFILILLLPFSKHWKLFLYGIKTEGKVVNNKVIRSNNSKDIYSVIEFSTDYETIRILGPDNLKYPLGKKITIYYNKNNPEDCMPMNIAAIYLGKDMILPGVLLIFWVAFYVSLKQTLNQKKKKKEKMSFHFNHRG